MRIRGSILNDSFVYVDLLRRKHLRIGIAYPGGAKNGATSQESAESVHAGSPNQDLVNIYVDGSSAGICGIRPLCVLFAVLRRMRHRGKGLHLRLLFPALGLHSLFSPVHRPRKLTVLKDGR